MSTFLETAPWVYSWLKNLELKFGQSIESGSLTVIPVVVESGKKKIAGSIDKIDPAELEAVESELEASFWQGKSNHQIIKAVGKSFLCVPFSKSSNIKQSSREFGLVVANEAKSLACNTMNIVQSSEVLAGQFLVGFVNGLYASSGFKKRREEPSFGISTINCLGAIDKEEINVSCALAKAQLVTRHLGDAPANWLNPAKFADVAKELSTEFGYKVKVLDKSEIIKEKMGSLMSVAQG